MDKIEAIKSLLLDFEWDNYGLDFVSHARPDWAEDLAERIATEC